MDELTTFSTFYLFKQHKELRLTEPLRAYLQYKSHRIDLLTGEKSKSGVVSFLEELSKIKINQNINQPIVIHLMFELGFITCELEDFVDDTTPLAIFIEYKNANQIDLYEFHDEDQIKVDMAQLPNFEDYQKKYETIYQHLMDGNCYQVNLTLPTILKLKEKYGPRQIINYLWKNPLKIGAFAHGTYLHSLDKFFVSNTPECLFKIENESGFKIKTMPIKGTMSVEDESLREVKWNDLLNSKKDQAELYMITDLMRNDLTKIAHTPSRVTAKKEPLNVPGLIHQYSVIETQLPPSKSIKDIVLNLFPGGSITGAPKKRVMEIIKEVEDYKRQFYCGSTILLNGDSKSASINIRSAEIDYTEAELHYGSGGGVTLLSNDRDEYDELIEKLGSFLSLWGEGGNTP